MEAQHGGGVSAASWDNWWEPVAQRGFEAVFFLCLLEVLRPFVVPEYSPLCSGLPGPPAWSPLPPRLLDGQCLHIMAAIRDTGTRSYYLDWLQQQVRKHHLAPHPIIVDGASAVAPLKNPGCWS